MSQPLALRLADQISAEILTGSRRAGARLDETGLAAQFGCSRTPVREALAELCARGLAQRRQGRGVEVIRPDPAALLEHFEALAELEALCAGLAAHRADLGALVQLEDQISAMEAAASADYPALNLNFHETICALSGNGALARVVAEMRLRLDALRGVQLRDEARRARSMAEHRDLLRAISARDAGAAAQLMREHLRGSARAALAVLARAAEVE